MFINIKRRIDIFNFLKNDIESIRFDDLSNILILGFFDFSNDLHIDVLIDDKNKMENLLTQLQDDNIINFQLKGNFITYNNIRMEFLCL